jgi:hypothetical protein
VAKECGGKGMRWQRNAVARECGGKGMVGKGMLPPGTIPLPFHSLAGAALGVLEFARTHVRGYELGNSWQGNG